MKTTNIILLAAGALALIGLKKGTTTGINSSCKAGMNCTDILDRTADPIPFYSCAQNGYFTVSDFAGRLMGKVDVPKGGCRLDKIARSYFPSGWYDLKITDYSGQVKSESWELL